MKEIAGVAEEPQRAYAQVTVESLPPEPECRHPDTEEVTGSAIPLGISHSFLTDGPDGTGLWHLCRTPGRTLTCDSGLRRTGRTDSIDLRIRRLGFESLRARPVMSQDIEDTVNPH
jgi:hypothetical protein